MFREFWREILAFCLLLAYFAFDDVWHGLFSPAEHPKFQAPTLTFDCDDLWIEVDGNLIIAHKRLTEEDVRSIAEDMHQGFLEEMGGADELVQKLEGTVSMRVVGRIDRPTTIACNDDGTFSLTATEEGAVP